MWLFAFGICTESYERQEYRHCSGGERGLGDNEWKSATTQQVHYKLTNASLLTVDTCIFLALGNGDVKFNYVIPAISACLAFVC